MRCDDLYTRTTYRVFVSPCLLSVTTSTKRSGGASGPPRVGGRPSKSRSRFLLPISSRQIDESIISFLEEFRLLTM
jgi:hypothetical protein